MINCVGEPLNPQNLQDIPNSVHKAFKYPKCCWVYVINWNGRNMKDVTCANSSTEYVCQINLKIFKATLYRHCFQASLKVASDALKKDGFSLKCTYTI